MGPVESAKPDRSLATYINSLWRLVMWPMVEAEMVVSFAGVDDLYMNETQVKRIQRIPKEQVKVMQDRQENQC